MKYLDGLKNKQVWIKNCHKKTYIVSHFINSTTVVVFDSNAIWERTEMEPDGWWYFPNGKRIEPKIINISEITDVL